MVQFRIHRQQSGMPIQMLCATRRIQPHRLYQQLKKDCHRMSSISWPKFRLVVLAVAPFNRKLHFHSSSRRQQVVVLEVAIMPIG